MELIYRRVYKQGDRYDVFNGERIVGHIHPISDRSGSQWFWGATFQVTKRKGYGYAATFDEAKAAFRTLYAAWKLRPE